MQARNLELTCQATNRIRRRILGLIKNYSPNTSKQIKKLVRDYISSVRRFVRKLERIRKQDFKLAKHQIQTIKKLLIKKKLYDGEVKDLLIEIEKTLENTVKEDGNFVSAINNADIQQNPIRGGKTSYRISSILREYTNVQNREKISKDVLSKIQDLILQHNKKLLRKPWRFRQLKKKLKNSTLELLSIYYKNFEDIHKIDSQIDAEESQTINDMRQMQALLENISSYFDCKDLQKKLQRSINAVDRWIVRDLKQEVKDEEFLKKVTKEVMELEKNSLSFSLLRPESMEKHESNIYEANDSQIVVHLTDFFPKRGIVFPAISGAVFKDQKTGKPFAAQSQRNTLHFSINHAVRSVKTGFKRSSWDNRKYAILIPMKCFPKDRIENFAPRDMWIRGKLKVPSQSIILARNHAVFSEVVGPGKFFSNLDKMNSFFNNKGIRVIILDKEFDKGSIVHIVDEYVKLMGRKVAKFSSTHNASEAHFLGEWGSRGGQSAMINRAKNFKYYFSESQTYYSEEHVKGLIKPSWQGYFPNLFNYMIREIIGVVKYLNEPEKRKVYLVVLNYMIESLEFMVSVMDAQIAALKESDILALSPEKQKEIGQVIRRFTIFVIGPISKPTEELRKILKVVDLLKEPYPNTYKQIISVISRIRKKGERFNRIFLGRYGDYSNTWRSTIDSKSTDLMRKWESITYLKIDL